MYFQLENIFIPFFPVVQSPHKLIFVKPRKSASKSWFVQMLCIGKPLFIDHRYVYFTTFGIVSTIIYILRDPHKFNARQINRAPLWFLCCFMNCWKRDATTKAWFPLSAFLDTLWHSLTSNTKVLALSFVFFDFSNKNLIGTSLTLWIFLKQKQLQLFASVAIKCNNKQTSVEMTFKMSGEGFL